MNTADAVVALECSLFLVLPSTWLSPQLSARWQGAPDPEISSELQGLPALACKKIA